MTPAELYEIVTEHGGEGSDAEIADRLNEQTTRIEHREPVTESTLLRLLEPAEYAAVRGALVAAATMPAGDVDAETAAGVLFVQGVRDALQSRDGLPLHTDRAQTWVETFRPALGDELTDKVKSIGVENRRLVANDVTADDVTRARLYGETMRTVSDACTAAIVKLNNATASLAADRIAALSTDDLHELCAAISTSDDGLGS